MRVYRGQRTGAEILGGKQVRMFDSRWEGTAESVFRMLVLLLTSHPRRRQQRARRMHVLRILVLLLAQADGLRVNLSRRQIVTAARNGGLLVSTSTLLPTVASATGNMPAVQGTVTKMDGSVKKASTPAAAKAQITAGFTEVSRLFADYDAIVASGGGDGVRRSLGVVGTESPIYLIEPAFRLLFEADDTLPMEYIEQVESLMRNLSSADSEAYSAIFIEFSSAKGQPLG